jgi:hypothetical protein
MGATELTRLTIDDQYIIILVLFGKSGPFSRHSTHLLRWRESDASLHKLEHCLLRIHGQFFIFITTEELILEKLFHSPWQNVATTSDLSTVHNGMAVVPTQSQLHREVL